MNPYFRTLTLILTILLTAYMAGCDQDEEEVAEEIPITSFVSADPLIGDINPNSTITVTFDNVPEDVKVSTGAAKTGKITVAGKTVTIKGPFAPGALPITIIWADGTQTLNYTVASPTLGAFPGVAVSISPASVESPAPGEQLVLNINIIGGENVAGYQLTLHFDDTALRYVSGGNANYLPAGTFVIPPLVGENQVTLAATSLNGGSQGEGTLATVTFEVIDVKTSVLTLSEVRLTDIDANFLPVTAENAEVVESL